MPDCVGWARETSDGRWKASAKFLYYPLVLEERVFETKEGATEYISSWASGLFNERRRELRFDDYLRIDLTIATLDEQNRFRNPNS